MDAAGEIIIGRGATPQSLLLRYANRHGLITGATGTGKTVTLQVLAEGFSRAGVPVFAADIKGDLSGIGAVGGAPKVMERARELGLDGFTPEAAPVIVWDVFGEQGHPIRATIAEMGPLLLSRLMGLNDTQEGVLNVLFRVADEQGLLLLDLADLRAMLSFIAEQAPQLQVTYGNVSKASVGAVQRALLVLEQQGGDRFFGEPALALKDLMRTTTEGRGYANLLAADKLMQSPRLYATFLLWLLAELFEELPEVGDLDKPRLVFFFDEAHLLFKDAPKALVEKIEQVVRLIRSKGVGVYFVTQNPLDVPETVLAQLGNRVQHALRAFTPRDQKAVRAAAETFRPNPAFKTEEAIMQLAVGEALVSTLQDKGVPAVVERVKVVPPRGRIGPLAADERQRLLHASPLFGQYDQTVDRDSAAERLAARAGGGAAGTTGAPVGGDAAEARRREMEERLSAAMRVGGAAGARSAEPRAKAGGGSGTSRAATPRAASREPPSALETLANQVLKGAGSSMARSIGSRAGTALVRGVLGALLKR